MLYSIKLISGTNGHFWLIFRQVLSAITQEILVRKGLPLSWGKRMWPWFGHLRGIGMAIQSSFFHYSCTVMIILNDSSSNSHIPLLCRQIHSMTVSEGVHAWLSLLGWQWLGTTAVCIEYWSTKPTLYLQWKWSLAMSVRLKCSSITAFLPVVGISLCSASGVPTSTAWKQSQALSRAQLGLIVVPKGSASWQVFWWDCP